MNREIAFTIELSKYPSYEFGCLLSEWQNEMSKETQPQYKKDDVIWFEPDKVPVELFKYADYFNWFKNSADIWHNDERVTKDNYRIKVYDVEPTEEDPEGVFHYVYIPWEEMTNTQPVIEETLNI